VGDSLEPGVSNRSVVVGMMISRVVVVTLARGRRAVRKHDDLSRGEVVWLIARYALPDPISRTR
jgi:hypothetical protein